MEESVRKYMAMIGSRGGRVSRRQLSPEQAKRMVQVREARRAYKKFYVKCFWSYAPDLVITASDLPWVGEQLMKHGGREAWLIGARFQLSRQ